MATLQATRTAAAELERRLAAADQRPARLAVADPVPSTPPVGAVPQVRVAAGPAVVLARGVAVPGGVADEVEMPDPETGARVVVLRTRTERMAERLATAGLLSAPQAAAAEWLRDAWERAGLRAQLRTQPWQRGSGGEAPVVRDAAAWALYATAVQRLSSAERRAVVAVVVLDEAPGTPARLAALRSALDALDGMTCRAADRAKRAVTH
jgi:hypothetical protein